MRRPVGNVLVRYHDGADIRILQVSSKIHALFSADFACRHYYDDSKALKTFVCLQICVAYT